MKNRNHRKPWLLQYSIVFAVVCLLTFSMQIYYGKSFVYSEQGLCGDGLVQHFNGLVYYGEYLRELLRNIFVEHTFSLPEYDLSIGMGGDIENAVPQAVRLAHKCDIWKTHRQILFVGLLMI